MSIAFLFAGQGAQYVGMGKDFYDVCPNVKELYDTLQMDFDVKDVCFNGPKEKLQDTAYTQCCIVATSLAIANVLTQKGIKPDYVAGLSLGEYSALTYAGVFDLDTVLPLVRTRGLTMAHALDHKETMMAAVLKGQVEEIEQICKQVSDENEICTIANYNSPKQIVITGDKSAVTHASQLLKEKGCKVLPLAVSGAFHSSLLEQAAQSFHKELEKCMYHKMNIPVVFNVSGQEETGSIVELLTRQMHSSVRFYQSIEYMIAKGVDTFIEIGPGKVLGKLVKQTSSDVKVYSIDTLEDLKTMLEEYHG